MLELGKGELPVRQATADATVDLVETPQAMPISLL